MLLKPSSCANARLAFRYTGRECRAAASTRAARASAAAAAPAAKVLKSVRLGKGSEVVWHGFIVICITQACIFFERSRPNEAYSSEWSGRQTRADRRSARHCRHTPFRSALQIPLPSSFDFAGYIDMEQELWALFPETTESASTSASSG